jgi:hypothetical protein
LSGIFATLVLRFHELEKRATIWPNQKSELERRQHRARLASPSMARLNGQL